MEVARNASITIQSVVRNRQRIGHRHLEAMQRRCDPWWFSSASTMCA
jgi:hypothetical protein